MRRTLSILVVAAVGLTACTDQPAPIEPAPTATVTETVTAEPADSLASQERVARNIAGILEASAPAEIVLADEAIAGLEDAILLSTDDPDCSIVAEVVPEVSAYGAVNVQEDDPEGNRGLAAFGFSTVADAAAFTEHLQEVLEECETSNYEIVPLTHHTDEALEIRVEKSDEPAASIVLIRNEYWVLTAVSTPPSDVALSLTQLDQLDEMLR